jgi:hypothetical protein
VVNALPGGKTDDGCRNDESTRLDSSGDYVYVMGTESERAAIERIPGATFLPFSSTQPTVRHILLLRNMLVSDGFQHSTRDVADARPGSAAAAMGPYYPRAAICPLNTLATRGLAACLPES